MQKHGILTLLLKLLGHPSANSSQCMLFVKGDEDIKHVPLAFMLMSGKRTVEYVAIIKGIVEVLPVIPEVKGTVVDMEAAIWNAIQEALPSDTWMYIRKLMTLPLVPKEHNFPLFESLKGDATSSAVKNVVLYIQEMD